MIESIVEISQGGLYHISPVIRLAFSFPKQPILSSRFVFIGVGRFRILGRGGGGGGGGRRFRILGGSRGDEIPSRHMAS